MIGQCIDVDLQPVIAAISGTLDLINPAAFINPQLGVITQLTSLGLSKQLAIEAMLTTGTVSISLEEANNMALLYNTFAGLSGGFTIELPIVGMHPYTIHKTAYAGNHALHQYRAMTDFFSGKLSVFPVGVLSATVPGVAVLGTMTFAGVLGAAYGGRMAANTLCQIDHENNPCGIILDIFGSILGAFDVTMNVMIAGLNLLIDLRTNILGIIATIAGYINGILQFIIQSITALINALSLSVRFALAKLLASLKLDPCLAQVLGVVAGVELKAALKI